MRAAERRSALGSLRRAMALSKGNRVRIFGVHALTAVLMIVAWFGLQWVLLQAAVRVAETSFAASSASITVMTYSGSVSAIAFFLLTALVFDKLYRQLRCIKDGPDSDEVAAVFD